MFTRDVFGGRVLAMKQTLLTIFLIVFALPSWGVRDAMWLGRK